MVLILNQKQFLIFKEKTLLLIRFGTDCLQKYVLMNPTYFCGQSVSNLISVLFCRGQLLFNFMSLQGYQTHEAQCNDVAIHWWPLPSKFSSDCT